MGLFMGPLPAHTYAEMAFSPFTTFRVSASFPRAAPANGGAAVSGGPRGRTESQLRAYNGQLIAALAFYSLVAV
jgi:hypothetical protein